MGKNFQNQLKSLNLELIKMGGLCEEAITVATEALFSSGEKEFLKVCQLEKDIDSLEREIENLCLDMLLLEHPVAGDLRNISASLKMISDMERIGDQAKDIGEISRYMQNNFEYRLTMEKMATLTKTMVSKSVEAFVSRDLEKCRQVILSDDLVDMEFTNLKEVIARILVEKNLDIHFALDLLMVAKYFERIGDHAVNIAEWVEFSINGNHKDNLLV